MSTKGLADRVKQFSTTTGTGTILLSATAVAHQSFLTAIGTNNPCAYVIEDGNAWEVGIGTVLGGGYLSRDSVLISSNSNTFVNLTGSVKRVFIDRVEAFHGADVYTTDETLTGVPQAVCLNVTGTGVGTLGAIFRTSSGDAGRSTQCHFVGFSLHAANANKQVLVRKSGIVSGFSGLSKGQVYYLGNDDGSITNVAPANKRAIGVAVSTTELSVRDDGQLNIIPAGLSQEHIGTLGHGSYSNGSNYTKSANFDYLDLHSTIGNSANRGIVPIATTSYGAGGGDSLAVFAGGASGTTSVVKRNEIQRFDKLGVVGDATDVGDLSLARSGLAGVGGNNKTYLGGGNGTGYSNVIDYINWSTFTGNSSDSGDLTVARQFMAACADVTNAYFVGGQIASGAVSQIDQLVLATGVQNATDRGDLTTSRLGMAGVSAANCIVGGGLDSAYSALLEVIDSATLSNVTVDRGELSQARAFLGSASNLENAVFAGGQRGIETDLLEMLNVTVFVNNVVDRGTISYARAGLSGV